MENIILGLLLLQPRSIYQLRKRIEQGLNLMYSCSMGSIQAAVKKLLGKRYIIVSDVSSEGRAVKTYSITEQGRAYFSKWVNSPLENDFGKNRELAKIYFMGFSDKANRVSVVEKYIEDLNTTYQKLDFICTEGDRLISREYNDILFFQLQSAKYGRDCVRFNIEWYKNFLKELR